MSEPAGATGLIARLFRRLAKPFARRTRPGERVRPVALLGLLPALLCAGLALYEPFAVRALRDIVFDGYQRLSPRPYDPDTPVRIVAIDDASLGKVGQWPWPRETVARLVRKLGEAGAASIALDVLFAEPERGDGPGVSPGDAALRDALAAYRSTLGMILVDEGGATPEPRLGIATSGDDPRLFAPRFAGAMQPIATLREAARGLGAMNITPDRDLVVREIPTLFTAGGALAPSFDVAALLVAQDASTLVVRASNGSATVGDGAFGAETGISHLQVGAVRAATGRDGSVRIHYAGSQPRRSIPAWTVLDEGFDPVLVENAIVLVGITAVGFDVRATPLSPVVAGVEIRAEMLESLVAGRQLTRPDTMPGLEALMVAIGALFAAAAASRLSPQSAAFVTIVLVLLFVGCSAVAFLHMQQLLNPVWPSIGSISALGVATLAVLRQSEAERRQVRDAFSRYVSPSVVETLSRDPSRLALGGENRVLTVMFSDIRGFTSRSETMPAEAVLRFLNSVHAPMTEHVLDSGGTLDKFIGDGMMAFWNAPLDTPDHVRAGLRTALQMQATVDGINRRLAAEDAAAGAPVAELLGLGIGIHTGDACIGNIGSIRRFDYSAIGDTVNTAARLEPMCKTYGASIIVSSDVADAAPDFAFLLLDRINLKGKSQATRLYALRGDETAMTPAFRAYRDAHDEAVRLILERHHTAFDALRRCAADPLGSGCSVLYAMLERRVAELEGASATQR